MSVVNQATPQVIFVCVFNFHAYDITRFHLAFAIQIDRTVDFRGIGHAAANRAFFVNFIDHHQNFSGRLFLQALGGDLLLQLQ
jgi:hypothetical protein